jgi:glutamate carboxypeptidase
MDAKAVTVQSAQLSAVSGLVFDSEAMLQGLRPWVECASPTYDAAAVNRAMEMVGRDFFLAGGHVERIPGRMGFGDCLRITFPHPRAGQPGFLILGHMDTVGLPVPWRREGPYCWGPGIADMKGGVFLSLEAIRQLRRASIATPLPVTVLLTSDEEVGSPSTRDLIEAEAGRQSYVLIPERGRDGGLVTGRYAIARFRIKALGTSTHAGHSATRANGRSAIREMIEKIAQIESMTCENYTFSVGVLHGGQWVNCVPHECTGEVLSMAKRQADLDQAISRMLALSSPSFVVSLDVVRPVWEADARTMALYEHARTLAQLFGYDLAHQSSGGGSDGNFTGAMGIPTLDALGAKGTNVHTLDEHIEVASLAERARLMAALLATLQ